MHFSHQRIFSQTIDDEITTKVSLDQELCLFSEFEYRKYRILNKESLHIKNCTNIDFSFGPLFASLLEILGSQKPRKEYSFFCCYCC